jgi:hypothetical protein
MVHSTSELNRAPLPQVKVELRCSRDRQRTPMKFPKVQDVSHHRGRSVKSKRVKSGRPVSALVTQFEDVRMCYVECHDQPPWKLTEFPLSP